MSTLPTQQQFLCHQASMRIKKKPLEENPVLLYTETNKPDPFIFNQTDTTAFTSTDTLWPVLIKADLANWQRKTVLQIYSGRKLIYLMKKHIKFV